MLFHALTGPHAVPDRRRAGGVDGAPRARPPVPARSSPGLPPAFDEVVRRALAKRPEDRFATAGELGRAALAARYDVALLTAPEDRPAAEGLAAGLRESELLPLVAAAGEPGAAPRASAPPAPAPCSSAAGAWATGPATAWPPRGDRRARPRLPPGARPPAGRPEPGDPGLAYLAAAPLGRPARRNRRSARRGRPGARVRGADVLPGLPAAERVPPYRGLEAFREEDASLYFGREQDIARILERLRSTRFLAVLGPSGSGKSSLVQAGLMPALRREARGRICAVPRDPARRAPARRAGRPARHLPGAGSPSAADLAADERALDLAVARALEGRPADERILVVVDQLEEVFTLCSDEGERAAFLGNLVYAATHPRRAHRRRHDDAGGLLPPPRGASGLRSLVATQQMLLGPLDARGLRRAIEEPARAAAWSSSPASPAASSRTSPTVPGPSRSSSTCCSSSGAAVATTR